MSNTKIKDDDYLLLVGRLIQNASVADSVLFAAFRSITKIDDKLAQAIFYTVDAFSMRKILLKRSAKAAGFGIEETKILDAIIAAAETINNQRQEVAHSSFGGDYPNLDNPVATKMKNMQQPLKPLNTTHLTDLMNQSGNAIRLALSGYQDLCAKLKAQPLIRPA